MRIGITGPQDVLSLLLRRKWWVIFPFVALTCAVALLTHFLPKIYVSETLILIRPRDIPADLVKDLIAGTNAQRLTAIQQTVLSRSNLIQIIREFEDSLPELRGLNMDEAVLRLRNEIDIIFETEKRNGMEVPGAVVSFFRITYQNPDPAIAQKICSKLTTLFIEQDNRARETQVNGTTEFFTSELAKVAAQLEESEGKVKEVKSSHQFVLPDQRDANLRTLDRLGQDKRTNAETLDRYATFLLNLESSIAQTPEFIPKPVNPVANAAAGVPAAPGSKNALILEYRVAKTQYLSVMAKGLKEKHPEVMAAKAHLDRAEKQLPADTLASLQAEDALDEKPSETKSEAKKDAAPADMIPNPVYENLAGQLRSVKTEMQIREKEKKDIEAEIAKYSQRVEQTPKAEQDIADAIRQNFDLNRQYEDLKSKLAQASLSESLESKQKGSQFIIVDAANYPLESTKPKKWLVALGGGILSLVIAIVFAVVVHIARQRVWNQSEIETFWGVPVLVDIPEILADSDQAAIRKKKVNFAAFSLAGAVVYSLCLLVLYVKHAPIIQLLDPVLQKTIYK